MPDSKTSVFISLGSNLGDRVRQIERALEWLGAHPAITPERCSALRETEPWGVVDQPRFINAVALISTTLSPRELLDTLKRAEAELGRKLREQRWGPREIDLDILLFGDLVVEEPDLVIPHERLTERSFVVEQILEVDGNAFHPKLKVPIKRFK
jgi:2-amino-4-hydroxy-6-hydroxymethyldihydropteridine diphosphokinase